MHRAELPYIEAARAASAAKAARWTGRQAERLGVSPDEILSAIRRAWLPSEIEALPVANAGDLTGEPPRIAEAREMIRRKLVDAPVLPIRDSDSRRRRRDHYLERPNPYRVAAE